MSESFKDTIVPKSDQLNADDLLCGPITVTVTGVRRGDKEQPVVIAIDGGYQPYKPCKSMRRVLIAAWGDRPEPWIGRRMTLFCDPEVKFGGVKVGGIRISHLSHIDGPREFMLTTTRSKRTAYVVASLGTESYPQKRFDELLPKWRQMIADGDETAESVIRKAEQRAPLTSEQRQAILNLETNDECEESEA